MLKKLLVSGMIILLSDSVYADQYWTSWRTPPNVLSVAIEDSVVWCATWDDGVISYNTRTGREQHYTVNNGLADNRVYCLALDNNGVKWFDTKEGLSRFDGSQWTHPCGVYIDMAIDQKNYVWGIVSNGIYRYDGFDEKKIIAGVSGQYIFIEISPSDVLWIAGYTKIYRVIDSNISEINIHEIVLGSDYIKDITVDEKTELLWYACSSAVYSFDNETGTETLELDDTVPDYAGYTRIDIDSAGNIWLAGLTYIALYRDGTLTNYYSDFFDDCTINDIAGDGKGNVWISTTRGLLRFDGQHFETIFDESELYQNSVRSIVIDNNNAVWCSHNEFSSSPLSCYENNIWKTGPKGMHDLLAVDDQNNLWGSYGGSLYVYDGSDITQQSIRVPLPGFECDTTSPGSIVDILFEDNDVIWIASASNSMDDCTTTGVFTCDGETVVPQLLGYFSCIAMDSKKNKWCGTFYDGLYRNDGGEWIHYTDSNGLPGNEIWDVEIDSNDVVWFTVFYGQIDVGYHTLGSFDNNTFTVYTAENSGLPDAMIYTIAIDHNNTKWLGTAAGVCRFDGETWTTFNTQNSGLCDNKVNCIAVEKNNTIWFGTDNGVSRYTGEVIEPSDVDETKPEALHILKTFPNPFNPSTTIEFTLPEADFTTFTIYNMAGQKICELASELMTAGTHRLQWDGKDNSGGSVSAGIYIARLKAGDITSTGKLVLVK